MRSQVLFLRAATLDDLRDRLMRATNGDAITIHDCLVTLVEVVSTMVAEERSRESEPPVASPACPCSTVYGGAS